MTQEGFVIIADEGKEFRRIEDGMIYGDRIALGYSYYIGGVKLTEPHKDVPEDFEEIDKPVEETTEEKVETEKETETPEVTE